MMNLVVHLVTTGSKGLIKPRDVATNANECPPPPQCIKDKNILSPALLPVHKQAVTVAPTSSITP